MTWQLQEDNGIKYYRSTLLAAFPWLAHGFSTRWVSKEQGVDSGLGSENATDEAESEEEKRRRFFALFQLSLEQVHMVQQVHGDVVIAVEETAGRGPTQEADGLMTNLPGVGLATVHADCVPVLLVDPVRRVIAAVHAGWKGTLAGIVPKALQQMSRKYGSVPETCWAAIGPAIGACCYPVSCERFRMFQNLSSSVGLVEQDGSYALDLVAINYHYLLGQGLPAERIDPANLCTACHGEDFYSYRREQTTSRMLSVIALKRNLR